MVKQNCLKRNPKPDSGGTVRVKESNKTYSDIICCHGLRIHVIHDMRLCRRSFPSLFLPNIWEHSSEEQVCFPLFSPKSLLRTWALQPLLKSGLRVRIPQPDCSDCSFSLGLTFCFPLSSNCLLQSWRLSHSKRSFYKPSEILYETKSIMKKYKEPML